MKESFKSAVKDEKEKTVRLNNMHKHLLDFVFYKFFCMVDTLRN